MGLIEFFTGVKARPIPRIEPSLYAASPENPSTSLSNPADWLDWSLGAQPNTFGPHVTERSAETNSAVYRSVVLLSGIFAMMPLKIYKHTKGGREEATDHKYAPFFKTAPYPGRPMTAFIWRELWGVNELLWGNHYSIIRYDRAARIVGFEPVMPWDVEVYRQNNRNVYRCMLRDSTLGNGDDNGAVRIEWHDQEDIIHMPGPGFNGIVGLSRIRHNARNSVALASVLEEQAGRIHENSARPSGLVSVTAKTKEGFDRFKAQFTDNYTGRGNAGRVIFGDPETKFTPFQMSQEDLNTIEFRRFQVADISRFFGVPLHLLNETDKSTSWGTGLSEQTLAFLIYTIEPDLGRFEAELNYKLFFGTDYYIEFDRDALMAMDPLKAAQVSQTEIQTGTLLINEYRRKKNRPPVEGGDLPLVNSAMVPLGKIEQRDAQPRTDPIQTDPLAPRPDVGTQSNDNQQPAGQV